jgi:hypothetical protein
MHLETKWWDAYLGGGTDERYKQPEGFRPYFTFRQIAFGQAQEAGQTK